MAGMTRAETIERAIRFIADAKARHGRRIGLEVGEHLLHYLYAYDERRAFRRDPTRDDSLRDIEKATSISLKTLSRWIKAAAVARRLAAHGIDPDIGLEKLAALFPIEHPDTLLTLVDWSRRVPRKQVAPLVRAIARHIATGGTLETFPDGPPRPPRPRSRPHPPRRTDELIVPRLVTLLTDWARECHLTAPQRRTLVTRLRSIRRRLT